MDVFLLIQSLYPLQFGAYDQDCVLAERTGIWSGRKNFFINVCGSARGLALMVADGRGYPGSDTGNTCGGEVVTASGGGNTESSASGRESSGVSGIGKDATVVSLGKTAEAATSTVTRPMGLERSGVFLMWEVGSCCDLVPKLGRVVSVYAAGMADREDSGGFYYDPTPGGDGP